MSIRVAFVVLTAVLAVAVSGRAQGQGRGQPPPSYQQLAAQIADLQARVAKLEGNIEDSDLAGTYTVTGLNTTMTALQPGFPPVNATINTSAAKATLILNSDGTGSYSSDACEGSTLTQGSWAMHGFDCNDPPANLTWTYAGGIITITDVSDNEIIPWTVALGGRLLILAFAPFHPAEASSDQALVIASRLR